MDIKITSVNSDGELSLSTGLSPQKATGLSKIVQQVVKVLLTTPGTDLWNPGMGGGLTKIISRSTSYENIGTINGQIAVAVMNTERFLLDEQIGLEIDDDSKLKSIKLVSITYDRGLDRWNIALSLKNVSGKTGSISIA